MASCGLPEEFCICVDLKKGGKIISGISFAVSIIAMIFMLIYLCSDIDEISKEIADQNTSVIEKLDDNKTTPQVVAAILLVVSIALFGSSLILLKGIKKQSKKLFIPYLSVLGITILLLLFVAVLQFEKGLFWAVLTLMVILIYFFICTLALYKRLENSEIVDTEAN